MYPLLQWATAKYGEDNVRSKIRVITDDAKRHNVEYMKFKISQDKTLERIEGLAQADQNIEYMNTGHPLVEYGMKRLIYSHEYLLNSALVLGDFDTSIEVKERNLGEGNNAFGNLLNEMARYYDKGSSPLLGRLTTFNQKKQKSSHRMYDESIDPDEVNANLRSYVEGRPITTIMQSLADEQNRLVNEMISKLAEYGYHIQGPPDLEELERLAREKPAT